MVHRELRAIGVHYGDIALPAAWEGHVKFTFSWPEEQPWEADVDCYSVEAAPRE